MLSVGGLLATGPGHDEESSTLCLLMLHKLVDDCDRLLPTRVTDLPAERR